MSVPGPGAGAGCVRREPARAGGCPGGVAVPLKTPDEEVDEYLRALAEMAEASGGGITEPARTVGDCPDWEDNRILDLASAVGALMIVSADADLTSMSPWRGRPVIEPSQFASMADASRRVRRRRW
jgi:predicted nucleic acid-binding protein